MSSVEWPRNFGSAAPAPVDVLDSVVMRTPTQIGTGIANIQSQDIPAPADLAVGDFIVIFGGYDNDSGGVADPVITGGSPAIWSPPIGRASTGATGVGWFVRARKATLADIGATFSVDLGKAEIWAMQCLAVTEATGVFELVTDGVFVSAASKDVESISQSWNTTRSVVHLLLAVGDGGAGFQFSSAPPEIAPLDTHYVHTGAGTGVSTAAAWIRQNVATFDPGSFGRNSAANQTTAILAIELRL